MSMTPQERALLDGLSIRVNSAVNKPSDSALRGVLDEVPEELDDSPANLPAGIIVAWSGSSASVPSGWGLCDGTHNATGSGINLSGRFIVCIGNDGDGTHATYSVGDTGGNQFHGGSENSHTDHTPDLNHTHTVAPGASTQSQCVYALTDISIQLCDAWAVGGAPASITTSGPAWTGASPKPDGSNVLTLNHSQTDNRPPFYALCYIEKLP